MKCKVAIHHLDGNEAGAEVTAYDIAPPEKRPSPDSIITTNMTQMGR
jgi:hypothetical protein